MSPFEKIAQYMRKPTIMLCYAILLSLVYFFIDKKLALYLHKMDLNPNAPLAIFLDYLGRAKVYVLLFLLLGLFFRFIRKNPLYAQRSWCMFFLILIPILLNYALKIFFGRARPELLFLNNEYGFYWFKLNNLHWSFPSGHTTTVIAMTSAIGALFPRYFSLSLFLGLSVMASRIMLCNHFLSDVMMGFYVTVLVTSSLIGFFRAQGWIKEGPSGCAIVNKSDQINIRKSC